MNIITSSQFNRTDIKDLISLAIHIKHFPDLYKNLLKDKILINAFFEPSTRTALSFQVAIMKLGGKFLQFNLSNSSITKKESFDDTIKVIEQYADIIVIRHPQSHILDTITCKKNKILINAGDGHNEHPTQSLIDLLTIYYTLGNEELPVSSELVNRLYDKDIEAILWSLSEINMGVLMDKLVLGDCNYLNITIVGDLKYSRTVHSLIYLLLNFDNIVFNLVSPKSLKLPEIIKQKIEESSSNYVESDTYTEFINKTNVLYMTRIQQERFSSNKEYDNVKNTYKLTINDLKNVQKNFVILHPLPRVNEIDKSVDEHSSAKYFQQVELGIYMRMAILCYCAKVKTPLWRDGLNVMFASRHP